MVQFAIKKYQIRQQDVQKLHLSFFWRITEILKHKNSKNPRIPSITILRKLKVWTAERNPIQLFHAIWHTNIQNINVSSQTHKLFFANPILSKPSILKNQPAKNNNKPYIRLWSQCSKHKSKPQSPKIPTPQKKKGKKHYNNQRLFKIPKKKKKKQRNFC